jgi:FAD-dependent monooxygenase
MNSGIEDALAVSWRLSAVLKGYGGPHLIPSYEAEQRPVMITRLERCNHWVGEHIPRYQWFGENGPEVLMAENEKGDQLRQQIKDFLDKSGSECLDRGIELDSRYKSAVIFQDGTKEPEWEFKKYFPSTLPGSRAPHVFLKDGKTSILDTYGPEFTLVTFTSGEEAASTEVFVNAAKEMKMELKTVVLRNEEHAHKIWGSNLILIRADGHVAWRSQEVPDREAVKDILQVVTGQKIFPGYVPAEPRAINIEGITSVSTEKYTDTELLALGESI